MIYILILENGYFSFNSGFSHARICILSDTIAAVHYSSHHVLNSVYTKWLLEEVCVLKKVVFLEKKKFTFG